MTTVLDSLTQALHRAFAQDERVLLIGEDLLDPYGGAFKVSRGLSNEYPDRVLTTPVSEAAITGIAGGMALRGLRPVVEIMFGDFSTLIADQLINSLSKFRWMYNQQVEVPVVIRTPMGGRRGYGPTHSQSLEKLYLGVPGLRVLAANSLSDPGELLLAAILDDPEPVFFIENKLLYLKSVADADRLRDFDTKVSMPAESYGPTLVMRLKGAPLASLTLATYGYMADLALEAAQRLAFEHEIFCELVVPSQLAPFSPRGELSSPLEKSLKITGRLLTIEEGTFSLGWGAEIAARAAQALGASLTAVERLAADEQPIPASLPLEELALPGVDQIIAAAQRMI